MIVWLIASLLNVLLGASSFLFARSIRSIIRKSWKRGLGLLTGALNLLPLVMVLLSLAPVYLADELEAANPLFEPGSPGFALGSIIATVINIAVVVVPLAFLAGIPEWPWYQSRQSSKKTP